MAVQTIRGWGDALIAGHSLDPATDSCRNCGLSCFEILDNLPGSQHCTPKRLQKLGLPKKRLSVEPA